MAFSRTLGKYLAPKHNQRLSIRAVHELWNAELHRAAGHTPCEIKVSEPPSIGSEGTFDASGLLELGRNISNMGKWQDAEGNIYSNDQIDYDLIELIKKGELHAYPGKDSSIGAAPAKEIQDTNLRPKTSKYFIDRDELGCFLTKNGHTLPAFWYEAGDEAIYLDRMAQTRESVAEQRKRLKAVIAEKEKLERELLDARPFMDPEHPFFAPELEAAVALWLELFGDKQEDDLVAHRPTMELWLKENRHETLSIGGRGPNKAIDRIVTVANYRKTAGRPRKSKIL